MIRKILGIIGCIYFPFWAIYGYLIGKIGALFYTTYVVSFLISLSLALEQKNEFLNTIACTPFLWFFFVDFHIHLIIAIVQTVIILRKTKFSKEGIYFSFIFYLVFPFLYDNAFRVQAEILIVINPFLFKAFAFYSLILSTFLVYLIKEKQKCLN